jgi:glycosyltransferase involved in cell wall biosynthesis
MKAEKILPRASIIIIAYNDETHVEAAIKSACGQTEEKIEKTDVIV